jgi:hypothetical protein
MKRPRHAGRAPLVPAPHPAVAVALLVAAAAIGGAGCGPGLLTPDGTPPPPLFSVRAEVAGALGAHDPARLRGALAWQVYSDALVDCVEGIEVNGLLDFERDADYITALRLQQCLAFTERGRTETDSVRIEPTFPASFSIPVASLPAAHLLTGPAGARLGIADVLIYSDDNNNGALDQTPLGADNHIDRVVGSSDTFDEDATSISFLVWREGELSPLWKFFVGMYGCPAPPVGPSTVTVELLDNGFDISCTVHDGAVTVDLVEGDRLVHLGCAADPERHVMQQPRPDQGIPADAAAVCAVAEGETPDLFLTQTPASVCPSFRRYSLVGCSDRTSPAACRATSWDVQRGDNRPGWWPCDDFERGRVDRFTTVPHGPVSDGLDDLFRIDQFTGLGRARIEDVVIEVQLNRSGETARFSGAALSLTDRDNNGVFNKGDSIEVRETVDVIHPGLEPGSFVVRVARAGGDPVPAGTWTPVPLPDAPRLALPLIEESVGPWRTGGGDMVAVYGYPEGNHPAFALEGIVVYFTVGGLFPVYFGAAHFGFDDPDRGSVELVRDVNGDGLFGPGDALGLRESADPQFLDFNETTVQTWGPQHYIEIQGEYAFNVATMIGYATIDLSDDTATPDPE